MNVIEVKGKSCAALPPHSAMGAGASGCVDAVERLVECISSLSFCTMPCQDVLTLSLCELGTFVLGEYGRMDGLGMWLCVYVVTNT